MKIEKGKTIHPPEWPYPVVAIGNFDGVHRGHQAILGETVRRAGEKNGTPVVLTFDPHPLQVLTPSKNLKFLMSFEERTVCFESEGILAVRAIPFSLEFASLEPEDFIRTVLSEELKTKEIWVGTGFRFGKDRRGTVDTLKSLAAELGYSVHPLSPLEFDGAPVSSSRIRENLLKGRVREAGELLGRPYSLEGEIVPATRRGRPMGYPTANFKPPSGRVIPENGIYAVRATLSGGAGKTLDGVSYIGTQPTLGPTDRMVETHLFDPQPDLYGKRIHVDFHEWVRGEQTFEGREDLIRNIRADIEKARDILTQR